MKHIKPFCGILLLSVLFIGCANSRQFIKPTQAQIDAYVQANPDLPEFDKQLIYDGRFEMGMKTSTVKFLLGDPQKIEAVVQPWGKQERWIYSRGGKKVFIIEENHIVGIEEL